MEHKSYSKQPSLFNKYGGNTGLNIDTGIVKRIEKIIRDKKINEEFEIRFGAFNNKKFTPGVNIDTFNNLNVFLKSFISDIQVNYDFIMNYDTDIRITQVLEAPKDKTILSFPNKEKVIKNIYIKKNKIENIDIDEYNIRFSLASETSVKNEKEYNDLVFNGPCYFKSRKRVIYNYKGFSIQLSSYVDGNKFNEILNKDIKYDIEFEIEKNCTEYHSLLEEILKVIQNTHVLIDKNSLDYINRGYHQVTNKYTFIGAQPETLDHFKLDLKKEYAITIKLDGMRYMLFVYNECIYSINSKTDFSNTGIKVDKKLNGCMFDTELYNGKYYIFDIIIDGFKDLRGTNCFLKQRLDIIKSHVDTISSSIIKQKKYEFGNIYDLTIGILKNIFVKETTGIDGLIYTPVNSPYPYRGNPEEDVSLKWKPLEMNTIDFKILKKGRDKTHETWELYVYDTGGVIFTYPNYNDIGIVSVPIDTAIKYYDKTVVEFYFDKLNNKFIPIKTRFDKVRGNYINVARNNFSTIIRPFDFGIMKGVEERKKFFFNENRFTEYVKLKIINDVSKAIQSKQKKVIDLFCGKGNNTSKTISSDIRVYYGFDTNKGFINSATEKAKNMKNNQITKNFDFTFTDCDLTKTVVSSGDTVNMALCLDNTDKFFENKDTINILIETVSNNLAKNGYFICFFKKRELLKNISVVSKELDVKIENNTVLINKEGILVKENIIDDVAFINKMQNSGFILENNSNFAEYYYDWEKNKNYLCNVERAINFTNNVLVFKKEKEIPKEKENPKVFKFDDFDDCLKENNYTKKELSSKKVDELRNICTSLMLDKKGKKPELIDRIYLNSNTTDWSKM